MCTFTLLPSISLRIITLVVISITLSLLKVSTIVYVVHDYAILPCMLLTIHVHVALLQKLSYCTNKGEKVLLY